ncbi:hypothetical protein CRG98_025559 [Punica granatum]|uniref:CCHC-type domain-containing protein n=1 Tax=Punica granatum TaxID=22663 RepID=A0A2I0JCT9_PUNGR|nr:hypothetical protein CRG98_025559 [Punica granatum]
MQSSLSGSGGMTKEEKDLLDRSVKCQMKLEMRGSSVEMEIEQVEKPEETSASPAIGAGPQIAQYSEALLENSTAPPVELGDVFFSKWEEDLAMIDFSNDIRPKILTTEEEISAWSRAVNISHDTITRHGVKRLGWAEIRWDGPNSAEWAGLAIGLNEFGRAHGCWAAAAGPNWASTGRTGPRLVGRWTDWAGPRRSGLGHWIRTGLLPALARRGGVDSGCLVLLGKRVSFTIPKQRLNQLWSSGRSYSITDLPNDHYLAQFSSAEDREWALTGDCNKGAFARICVEIDLTKSLRPKFELRSRVYGVEYEGLHLICFDCGRFGHWKEECCVGNESVVVEGQAGVALLEEGVKQVERVRPSSGQQEASEEPAPTGGEIFGPWMQVHNRHRNLRSHPAIRGDNGGKKDIMGAQKGRSRFAFTILGELEGENISEEIVPVGVEFKPLM